MAEQSDSPATPGLQIQEIEPSYAPADDVPVEFCDDIRIISVKGGHYLQFYQARLPAMMPGQSLAPGTVRRHCVGQIFITDEHLEQLHKRISEYFQRKE